MNQFWLVVKKFLILYKIKLKPIEISDTLLLYNEKVLKEDFYKKATEN